LLEKEEAPKNMKNKATFIDSRCENQQAKKHFTEHSAQAIYIEWD